MPSNSPIHSRGHRDGPGRLYVVATPIGNMDDITIRALRVLGEVELVAAEDTRHTGKLLARHHIKATLTSYHEHNEKERTPLLVAKMIEGASVALVTDAGTPSVSDPGYRLIRTAAERGVPVSPIPGASAAIAALSVSGLPSDAFAFEGFPSRKKGRRIAQLESLATESRTLIFYESPKRVCAFLRQIEAIMGDRYAVLVREMTKLHEEIFRGTVSEIALALEKRPAVKGELTLVLSGAGNVDAVGPDTLDLAIRNALSRSDGGVSAISREIAGTFGIPRSRAYAEILKVKREGGV